MKVSTVLPVLWWMMNLCKHHQLIDLAVGRWQKLQEQKVSVSGMKNQPPYKQLGFISAPTKRKAVMWTQWFPSQYGLLGGCSVCSCQPSSACDPPRPRPSILLLLLIYLMTTGGKKGAGRGVRVWSWGVVEIFYGNWVIGGHAHQLAVLCQGWVTKYLEYQYALVLLLYRNVFSSLFGHCLWKTERRFFFFMLF